LGTFSVLNFSKVIQAERALLAGKVEENTWLFKGQIRSILESLGFDQHQILPLQEALLSNPKEPLPIEDTVIEQAENLLENFGESLTNLFANRWKDYLIEIFPSEISLAIIQANHFTTSLVTNLERSLEETLKRLIVGLETKLNQVVLRGTLQSLANFLGFLLFNNLFHYLVIPVN